MIKKKKIVSCVLGISLLAGCFMTGCTGKEKPETSEIDKEEVVTLYDFEKGTANVRMTEKFGKIDVNEIAEYVKEGKRSLVLSPSGEFSTGQCAYFPFESSLLRFNYDDVTQMPEFTMDVYSTVDTAINVGLYFSKTADNRSVYTTYELKEGWNTISYTVEYSLIRLQYDFEDCKGLYISFDGEKDEMPVVYLDNLSFKKEQVTIENENLIVLKRTEKYMEICDFENAYQNFAFTYWNTANNTPAPEYEIVRAADYGITASSGEKVLRVKINASTNANQDSWSYLGVAAPIIDKINFAQFDGSSGEWNLKFDVYLEETEELGWLGCCYFYGSADSYGGGNPVSIKLEKEQWVEYSYCVSEQENFIEDPYTLAFHWGDPKKEGDCVFYVDNIRLEKAEEEE